MSDTEEMEKKEEALLRSKTMTHYDAYTLFEPLREAMSSLVISYMEVAAQLVRSAEDQEQRDIFFGAFEKLDPVFKRLEQFDELSLRMLDGRDLGDKSDDAKAGVAADE